MKRILLILFLLVVLGTGAAYATTIYSPLSATASSVISLADDINNTIDQSGLSIFFVSGVTDWDLYFAGNPNHSFQGDEWFAEENVSPVKIDYDMGSVMDWGKMAFWNDEFSGVESMEVQVSTDNISFSTIATGLMPTNHSSGVISYPADIFDIGTFSARYIRLQVTGPQPDPLGPYIGFGEVAFEGGVGTAIPEPTTMLLFGSGLIGLAGFRRRFKK